MRKLIEFPVVQGDRLRTIDQHMGRGPRAIPETTLAAFLRWTPEYGAREAAICCLTSGSYDEAVLFWLEHTACLRRALGRRWISPEHVEKLVAEYTALVRSEIKIIRAEKMTEAELADEHIAAIVIQPVYGGRDA